MACWCSITRPRTSLPGSCCTSTPGGIPAGSVLHRLPQSLRRLYRSAYPSEAFYGNQAQQQSGAAQLITNREGDIYTTVGMSMGPPLWIVNFALIYTLGPRDAAKMPAWWTPIPDEVAQAIYASPTGQVPYAKYKSLLKIQ